MISRGVEAALSTSSAIRKMFEEGIALKAKHGKDNVFDFSLGNPDLPPPPAFSAALAALAADKTSGVHGYMPNAGFAETRAALAKKISAEQRVEIPSENIVMSVGAAGALNVVFKAILDPKNEVIVPAPFFGEYRAYTANHGGVLVPVKTKNDFDLDLDAIAAALDKSGANTRAIIINSPNNPTGRVYNAAALDALCGVLKNHGKKTGCFPYIVADEPYREIVYGGAEVPAIFPRYSNAVVCASFSKTLSLPGERIGAIAVSPKTEDMPVLVDALIYATRTLGFVNAPALMQRCVTRLTNEKVDVAIYERRRNAFTAILDEAGISYAKPDGAFYIFARTPSRGGGVDDEAFVAALKNHLILGVPGSGFGAAGWVRFAYCADEKIINASRHAFLAAVKDYLNQ